MVASQSDILRDLTSAKVAFQLRALELILGIPATVIEARSDETEGLGPQGESAQVAQTSGKDA